MVTAGVKVDKGDQQILCMLSKEGYCTALSLPNSLDLILSTVIPLFLPLAKLVPEVHFSECLMCGVTAALMSQKDLKCL